MSSDLIFYTNPQSRGQIIRWMLEEIGCPYETRIISYGPELKSPEYRAINPMGKIPAIIHKGAVVTECAAICAYLADAFPEAGLAPAPGTAASAAYYRWLFFTAGPLEAAITDDRLGVKVPPGSRAFVGYGSFEDTLDALEGALKGKAYIAGDSFSAADVYIGSHLFFGIAFGPIKARQAFTTYVSRLRTRPAALRAQKIDQDLIAKAA